MYRTALRSSPGAVRALRAQNVVAGSRRFLSTAPADKKRTWKGAALRWGIAIGAVYFYNTSAIFADEAPGTLFLSPRPSKNCSLANNDVLTASTYPAPPQFSDSELSTVDAIVEEKRRKTLAAAPPPPPVKERAEPKAEITEPVAVQAETQAETQTETPTAPEPGSPEALEQEAEQQGAFNPETGEINWDCPCLGGMAHGPCGEEFKAAFSCFVYSKEEPKGMDCIDKFQCVFSIYTENVESFGANR